MTGYWARYRLLLTLIICAAAALIASLLFVYPDIIRQADYYNSQSIYKNTEIDFIAPEPSFDQIDSLPGTNGIDRVFPFFLTKTQVNVNGTSRTTTVLLSDTFQDADSTMYNQARLIEKSSTEYDNPILVDWQFYRDTAAHIGDTVSFTISGNIAEYKIYAVYETNSVYDGGAILAAISEEQKAVIIQQSNNTGYSGMYITASDYNACRAYLTAEYRPLGRLKNREQFSDDDQYQLHYDAIMSSGYANEITDFRIRENSLNKESSSLMVWIGAVLSAVILICFNITMARRGCERVYFARHCIPQGRKVKPYYITAFIAETVFSVALFVVSLVVRINLSNEFIPGSAIGIQIAAVPAAILFAEVVSLIRNDSAISKITRTVEIKAQTKEQTEAQTIEAETQKDAEQKD